MPFTLNTMVLLPFLRSLPAAAGASIVLVLAAMIGLDLGILGLGRPETAADEIVALMMSFSVISPAMWAVYMAVNAWNWAVRWFRRR